ncbi:hypothetical protein DL95DRAFT_476600 [Leptodontidium sp. 2 PMI_412]|nr:hypothetical protein DL95DRAFT_476600 [Leptodontidium sp. 2 PMI_412]
MHTAMSSRSSSSSSFRDHADRRESYSSSYRSVKSDRFGTSVMWQPAPHQHLAGTIDRVSFRQLVRLVQITQSNLRARLSQDHRQDGVLPLDDFNITCRIVIDEISPWTGLWRNRTVMVNAWEHADFQIKKVFRESDGEMLGQKLRALHSILRLNLMRLYGPAKKIATSKAVDTNILLETIYNTDLWLALYQEVVKFIHCGLGVGVRRRWDFPQIVCPDRALTETASHSIESELCNPELSRAWSQRPRERLLNRRHMSIDSSVQISKGPERNALVLPPDSSAVNGTQSRHPITSLSGRQFAARWKGPTKGIYDFNGDCKWRGDYDWGWEHECDGDLKTCRLSGQCTASPFWSDSEKARVKRMFSPFRTNGEGWKATFQTDYIILRSCSSHDQNWSRTRNERMWISTFEDWLRNHHHLVWKVTYRCSDLSLEHGNEHVSVISSDHWVPGAANILFHNWQQFSQWRTTVDDWFGRTESGVWVSEHFDQIVEEQRNRKFLSSKMPFFKDFRMGRHGGGSRKDWKTPRFLPHGFESPTTEEDRPGEQDDASESSIKSLEALKLHRLSYEYAKQLRGKKSFQKSIKQGRRHKSVSAQKASWVHKCRHQIKLDVQDALDDFHYSTDHPNEGTVSDSDSGSNSHQAFENKHDSELYGFDFVDAEMQESQASSPVASGPSIWADLFRLGPEEQLSVSETQRPSSQSDKYANLERLSMGFLSDASNTLDDILRTSNDENDSSSRGGDMISAGAEPTLDNSAPATAEEHSETSNIPPNESGTSKRAQRKQEAALRRGLPEYTRFPQTEEEEQRRREMRTARQRRQRQHRAAQRGLAGAEHTAPESRDGNMERTNPLE